MTISINKKYITFVGLSLTILFLIYGLQSGLFTSQQKLQTFLLQAGLIAPLLFIIIQIVQCVIPIIPGGVSTVIGVIVFGPVYGFIYNYIGICIGSIINFYIAKQYGKEMIIKMISQETYDHYVTWLEKGKTFNKFFALAILLPCAPDDILCYLAGLTPISPIKYIAIILLCKPWSILVYSMSLHSMIQFFI